MLETEFKLGMWLMPAILVLGSLRQEAYPECKVSLTYRVNPASKHTKKVNQKGGNELKAQEAMM